MLHRLVRNTLWRSAAEVTGRLGSALFWILLARFLGASAFGAISFAIALLGFFDLLSSLGLGSLLTRDAAQDPAAAAAFFGQMLLIGLVSACAGAMLMVATAWFVDPAPATQRMVLLLAATLPASSVAYWSKALLTAAERMDLIGAATLLETSLLIVPGFVLLTAGQGILAVAVALALSKVAASVLLYRLASRHVARPLWSLDSARIRYLLRHVPLFLGTALCNATFWSAAVILITWRLGESAAGHFSAAFKLISYSLLFAITFSQALLPVASRLAREDRKLYERLLRRALHYLLIFFTGLAALLSLLAEPLIRTLYGPGMEGAVVVLRWLAWMLVPYGLIPALAYTLVSHHQPRRDMAANLGGALTLIAATLLLLPRFPDSGAAVAMLLGALVFAAIELGSVHRLLYRLAPDRGTLAVIIAGGGLALGLELTASLPLLLRAALGTALYGGALWLMGALDRVELVRIGEALRPAGKERLA